MAEFETLKAEKIEFNEGGEFLELSINVARDGDRETRYIRLTRGYYTGEGDPRYKRGGTTLPGDAEVLKQLSDALRDFDLSELKKDETAEKAEE